MQQYFKHEVECFDLLPEGTYDFLTKDAGAAESKAGKPMLKLSLLIQAGKDKFSIKDSLAAPFKFKQFWDAVGMPEKYSSGNNLISDYNNKVGKCKIKHEEYNGQVSAKVNFYIKNDHPAVQDDDIAF